MPRIADGMADQFTAGLDQLGVQAPAFDKPKRGLDLVEQLHGGIPVVFLNGKLVQLGALFRQSSVRH